MKFSWIGGATWLLELGAFRVLGDPVFAQTLTLPAGESIRVNPLPATNVSSVDTICVSCLRPDHFDSTSATHVDETTRVVCPQAEADEITGAGFDNVEALAWFAQVTLEKNGETLVITAVPAISGSGDDNGYFFEHNAGDARVTAYCTGDALWSDEIRHIQQELGYSNLLIQHVGAELDASGGLTSPSGKEAMQFVYRMQPNAIAAVHHSTFSHYTEPFQQFRDPISRTIYDRRLRVLAEGESFTK